MYSRYSGRQPQHYSFEGRVTLGDVAGIFAYRRLAPLRAMVEGGLPLYETRSSEAPLSGDAISASWKSLLSLYVDACKVAEVIESRKSDPPSLIGSRLERLAGLSAGAGKQAVL